MSHAGTIAVVADRFWIETLGCPKNAVDSDKVRASLLDDGLEPAAGPDQADLVVVNTSAFIEPARRESIDTILTLADARAPGARLVVTGCLAERAGAELAAELPEVDAVVGFAGEADLASVTLDPPRRRPRGVRDLLELPAPPPSPPGRTSRSPRAATGPVASAPSRRSAGRNAPATPTTSSPSAGASSSAARRGSSSSPRTSPGTDATSVSPDRSPRSSPASTRS